MKLYRYKDDVNGWHFLLQQHPSYRDRFRVINTFNDKSAAWLKKSRESIHHLEYTSWGLPEHSKCFSKYSSKFDIDMIVRSSKQRKNSREKIKGS